MLLGGLQSDAITRLILDGETVTAVDCVLLAGVRIRDFRQGPDGLIYA
ncbi:MAG: hypothetical protein EXR01_01090 [Acetobacteraceae bacterium]|nr:hypothetical protein [Acetobacteraceae bacterium]